MNTDWFKYIIFVIISCYFIHQLNEHIITLIEWQLENNVNKTISFFLCYVNYLHCVIEKMI